MCHSVLSVRSELPDLPENAMTGERDGYGILVDPAEHYQEFMPGLYDIEAWPKSRPSTSAR
jgi:hypothetical protein